MDNHALSNAVTVLEYRVTQMEKDLQRVDAKLDQLLELRSKGMGAFWLASILFGTGLVGLFTTLMSYLKG